MIVIQLQIVASKLCCKNAFFVFSRRYGIIELINTAFRWTRNVEKIIISLTTKSL